ncbi:MAG TPA: hypothetical protein VIK91_09775, partial [Nannocystis sp.]
RKTTADRPADASARPAPPAAPVPPPERSFTDDGVEWIARIAGEAVVGKGAMTTTGAIAAVHFHRADDPERPLRYALLPRGHFERLGEDELIALFRSARTL